MTNDERIHLLGRFGWHFTLAAWFVIYTLVDRPTHVLLWDAARPAHASFFLLTAFIVAATAWRTPRPLLATKAALVFAVAFSSAIADLNEHTRTAARWHSASTWVLIIVANLIAVGFRLSEPGDRRRV